MPLPTAGPTPGNATSTTPYPRFGVDEPPPFGGAQSIVGLLFNPDSKYFWILGGAIILFLLLRKIK
jgi:hypothetical protein